jgi:hypothetical protein
MSSGREWLSQSHAEMNRGSPARLDGGRGFSRTRFAEASSPLSSLHTPHGDGIS